MHAEAKLRDAGATPSPHTALVTLADRLARTIAVARALVQSGRHVDLRGIEDGIGLLCAKSLDLPREESAPLLPVLHGLRAQVESMINALRASRGA